TKAWACSWILSLTATLTPAALDRSYLLPVLLSTSMFLSRQFFVLVVAAMTLASPTTARVDELCLVHFNNLTVTLNHQCGALASGSTLGQAGALRATATQISKKLDQCTNTLKRGSLTDPQCTAVYGMFDVAGLSVYAALGCFKDKEPIFRGLGDAPIVKTALISFKAETLAYLKELAILCKSLNTYINFEATEWAIDFDNTIAAYP
ncbi:hypothetical protein C8R46DRAFT_483588, partial [Mycena filopes]